MHITRLLLVHSGTYNDMALRPYTTHFGDDTMGMFQEATHQGTMFEAAALSSVAGSILRPSTAPVGSVSIANGWGTRRFRFIMEVAHDIAGGMARNVQYVSGYTDHADISYAGTIDPNMRLFVNTSIITREILEDTPMGRQMRRTLVDASHIVSGVYRPELNNLNDMSQTMRPEDVFGSIGASVLGDASEIFDMRSSFAGGAKKSRINNSCVPTYLSRVMNSYNSVLQSGGYDDDLPALMRKARADVGEGLIAQDPFLSNLTRNTSFAEGTSVCYGELCAMSPGLDDNVVVNDRSDPVAMPNFAPSERGSTENWTGLDNNTLFATIISQSMPAIMMDNMITEAAIFFSNRTMDGQFRVEFLAEPMSFIADRTITSQLANPLIRRFQTEVLRDLTQNSLIPIEGTVYCDVLGETRIRISAGNEYMTDYVAPAFCDALTAPIITNNADNLRNLSSDLSSLVDNVSSMQPQAAFGEAPGFAHAAMDADTPKSFFG